MYEGRSTSQYQSTWVRTVVRTRAPDPPILACIADARLQAALHPRMQHPGGGNRGADGLSTVHVV